MSETDSTPPVSDEQGQVPTVVPRREVAMPEGLAAALQMQAEVLRRMHEEQMKLSSELRDRSRSELMIRSTHALNESFEAMRHSQEALAERLEATRPSGRRTFLLVSGGVLVLAGTLFFALQNFGGEVADALRSDAAQDGERVAALESLEARIRGVEGIERDVLLQELGRLRSAFEANAVERANIARERDQALDQVKAGGERIQASAEREERVAADLTQARTELTRLTERVLADQKLLQEQNRVIEELRAAQQVPVAPLKERPAAADAAPKSDSRPADVALLADLNAMLSRHNGYERYVIKSAESVDGLGLSGVVFEVWTRDQALARVVEAERLSFQLTAPVRLLELTFTRGAVTFHQGVARTVRSPFFNDRYQMTLLGVDPAEWTSAKLPFAVVGDP